MAINLKAALIEFPHTEALLDRSIELSDGAVLNVHATDDDLGLVESAGYDVWELPVSRYIAAKERGYDITAIPVFATRRFIQWMIEVPEDSDIRSVKELEGKRLVESYHGNTDNVWTRAILEESYGVDLSGVSWFTLRPERVPGTVPPPGTVCLEGQKRDEIVLNGTADAALTSGHGNPIRPGMRLLWTNPEGAAAEWYKSDPCFPILHLVVVRDGTLEAHPSLAHELFQLFEDTKHEALVKWDYGASLPEEKRAAALWSGFPGSAWDGADRSFLGRDPIPYGLELEANRDVLERIIRYSFEHGVTQRVHSLEELFAPVDR